MSSWEPFRLNPVHPNRLGDVLDLLLAEIVERYRQLIAHLIVNDSGDAYRTRLGQSFETSGDIDAITEQILAIHHPVANVHAYAKLHRLVGANTRILRGNRCLHRDRASHGIDRAGEIGDDTVPSGVEDAAPMRRDQVVDNGPVGFQPRKRANLVAPHQPAVAGNVGGEDRRKFALYRVDGHACTSPTEYSETRNQPPDLFRRPLVPACSTQARRSAFRHCTPAWRRGHECLNWVDSTVRHAVEERPLFARRRRLSGLEWM